MKKHIGLIVAVILLIVIAFVGFVHLDADKNTLMDKILNK